MPRYEYQCDDCGAVEEISRTVATRNDPMNCGQLGCEGSMKLIPSLGGFTLAGGGWTPKGSFPTPDGAKAPLRPKGYDMTGSRDD